MEEEYEGEEEEEEIRDRLRQELLMNIKGSHALLSFISYRKSFHVTVRTKASRKELGRIRNMSEIEKFTKYKHGIKEKEYSREWEKMNYQQRVEELKSYGSHQEFIIKKLIEKGKKIDLLNLLRKYFPVFKQMKLTKDNIVREILDRYHGRSVNLEIRKFEEENLDIAKEFQVKICGRIIPDEIVLQIFSFLTYDSQLLFNVGLVSKSFYLKILLSWPKLKIKKQYVYDISNLLLRNISHVIFESLIIGTGSFSCSEIHYILSKIRSESLEKIDIHMDLKSFSIILKHFSVYDDPSVFQSVKFIRFSDSSFVPVSRYRRSQEMKKKKINLKSIFPIHIFPNLISFRNVQSLEEEKDHTIRSKWNYFKKLEYNFV